MERRKNTPVVMPGCVPLRDLVVRLADGNGRTVREWRVPLTELGPHMNTAFCPTVEVSIEAHSPRKIGTIPIGPWGEGQ